MWHLERLSWRKMERSGSVCCQKTVGFCISSCFIMSTDVSLMCLGVFKAVKLPFILSLFLIKGREIVSTVAEDHSDLQNKIKASSAAPLWGEKKVIMRALHMLQLDSL